MQHRGLAIVAALVLAGLAVAMLRTGDRFVMASAMFLAPPFAWLAARLLVHGADDLWTWFTRGSMKPWNGRYYEFGGHHLRPVELGDALAFHEEDVLAIIERQGAVTVELFGEAERVALPGGGMALTRAGCERLLLKCPHRDAKKLLLWLQREVFPPWDRRHGRPPAP